MSTLVQEQDNFLRYAILTVEHSTEALQNLIELNLRNKHLTFEKFLDQNQHEIYHFCYGSKCCLCQPSSSTGKQFMNPSQLETLFDKHNKKLSCCRANSCTDFCCSKPKVNITTQVLDLSLARCLLVNCCLDVFWFTCLATQGQTLEQFLNYNKHIIYHLCKNNDQKCCQCPTGFIFPRNYPVITENEWQGMFNSVLLPCINDRKRKSTGTTSVCSVAAMPGKDIKDIRSVTQGLVLKWCCSVRKSVEKLVEYRNLKVAHVTNARLSDVNFTDFFKETEECILDITTVCGNKKMKDAIKDLRVRPIDSKLCAHYQNILLQNINRNEHINENIHFQHRTTRQLLSRKVRKMNKQIGALKKSNVMLEKKVQLIHQQIIEGPNRQTLIDMFMIVLCTKMRFRSLK